MQCFFLKNRTTILIHYGIISIHSNLKWKGGYIMSENDMLATMELILTEMREMRFEFEQRFDRIEQRLDNHDAQFAALINGQTVLTNSIAEVKDTLSARIEETQKDNKDNYTVLCSTLYDIALLKTKVE